MGEMVLFLSSCLLSNSSFNNLIERWIDIAKIKKIKLIKFNPYDLLDDNSKELIKQIKDDLAPVTEEGGFAGEYDCFCLFEGKVGTGKSNAANLYCLAIDSTFSPERIIYRDWHYWRVKANLVKNLNKDIDACRGKAINIDELRRILFSKDSMNYDTKAIEKDLGDIRALGLFITACIDDAKSILRYVRDTRIDIWFYCRKRGEIWVYKLYTTPKDRTSSERRMNFVKQQLMKGIHPYTPYKIKLKPIPKNSEFWIRFKRREMRYKGAAAESRENIKIVKLDEKFERLRANTLTKSQTAKKLHVTTMTLDRWRKKKKLIPMETYKGYLYKIKDIDKLIPDIRSKEDDIEI